MKKVAIIGGGLAGLVSSIVLSKKGVPCILFEKKKYPFHRVCGEYISNETLPFLRSLDIFPDELKPKEITRFELSSVRGQTATMPLDLGAFSVSRHSFDHYLSRVARSVGVDIREETEITSLEFSNNVFVLQSNSEEFHADVVLGSYGKRSKLDVSLKRDFIKQRSPFIGVKYHVKNSGQPVDLISLHNFEGGYCGVVNIENDLTNICYLASRETLKRFKDVRSMEGDILFQNPFLKKLFSRADFIYEKPLVINEITFATKKPVENHILMTGDAAGMITPLCGNGMAMAIHSAKIASHYIYDFCSNKISRNEMERNYSSEWTKMFSSRLRIGRNIQKLFGNKLISDLSVNMILKSPPIARFIMKHTHGKPF